MKKKCVRVMLSDSVIEDLKKEMCSDDTLSSVCRRLIEQSLKADKDSLNSRFDQIDERFDKIMNKLSSMSREY